MHALTHSIACSLIFDMAQHFHWNYTWVHFSVWLWIAQERPRGTGKKCYRRWTIIQNICIFVVYFNFSLFFNSKYARYSYPHWGNCEFLNKWNKKYLSNNNNNSNKQVAWQICISTSLTEVFSGRNSTCSTKSWIRA